MPQSDAWSAASRAVAALTFTLDSRPVSRSAPRTKNTFKVLDASRLGAAWSLLARVPSDRPVRIQRIVETIAVKAANGRIKTATTAEAIANGWFAVSIENPMKETAVSTVHQIKIRADMHTSDADSDIRSPAAGAV